MKFCSSNSYRNKKNKVLSKQRSVNASWEWENEPQRGPGVNGAWVTDMPKQIMADLERDSNPILPQELGVCQPQGGGSRPAGRAEMQKELNDSNKPWSTTRLLLCEIMPVIIVGAPVKCVLCRFLPRQPCGHGCQSKLVHRFTERADLLCHPLYLVNLSLFAFCWTCYSSRSFCFLSVLCLGIAHCKNITMWFIAIS